MMTHTADTLALLKAIAAFPDEDVPRLAYADAIEDDDPARAELIRVQCGLARCPQATEGPPPDTDEFRAWKRGKELSICSAALLDAHSARWRAAGPCENPQCVRGRHVSVPGKAGIGWKCETCSGSGDRGGLTNKCPYCVGSGNGFSPKSDCVACRGTGFRVGLTWDRGFVAGLTVPTMDECVAGGELEGPGGYTAPVLPSDWLRGVLTATPERGVITSVVPLDAEVQADGLRRGNIPLAVWKEVCKARGQVPGLSTFCEFDSAADALAALGRALATFGRAT